MSDESLVQLYIQLKNLKLTRQSTTQILLNILHQLLAKKSHLKKDGDYSGIFFFASKNQSIYYILDVQLFQENQMLKTLLKQHEMALGVIMSKFRAQTVSI